MKHTSVIGQVLLGALLVNSVLVCHAANRRPARRRRELIAEVGPTDEMIWDTGLLEQSLAVATLYEKGRQWHKDVSIKRFQGPVLGYVTPWHRRGYDNAVRFRAKLTHVAPVWYQLKRNDKVWLLEGGYEYNKTWIDEVRQPIGRSGSAPKIVPRVIVQLDAGMDHVELVTQPEEVIAMLVQEVLDKDYDGLVLEIWVVWAQLNALSNDAFMEAATALIKEVHRQLHAARDRSRQLILAVPPPVPQGYNRPFVTKEHMRTFSRFVDFWSLMTYDYAASSGPQPNSPVPWLEKQHKVLYESDDGPVLASPSQALMGINFYGYDCHVEKGAPEAIIADGMLPLLAKHQPALVWHEDHQEHYFDFEGRDGPHRVYFPTPRSLEVRLEMFMQWGAGISIWELGQGLECFFDLL